VNACGGGLTMSRPDSSRVAKYEAALRTLDRILKLQEGHDLELPEPFWMKRAEVTVGAEDYLEAIASATRYWGESESGQCRNGNGYDRTAHAALELDFMERICVAEETFFRGLLQRHLRGFLRGRVQAPALTALLVGAVAFGVAHFAGGTPYVLLAR